MLRIDTSPRLLFCISIPMVPLPGMGAMTRTPMAEMFKYATDLRSMTQARGSFRSEFTRYEDVPAEQAKKIIEAAKREDEEEE